MEGLFDYIFGDIEIIRQIYLKGGEVKDEPEPSIREDINGTRETNIK